MSAVKLIDFSGMIPRRSPRLLPEQFSSRAINCNLDTGELRPLRAPQVLHVLPGEASPMRVFRAFGPGGEIAWYGVDYAESELIKSPLVNDGFDRWYLFEPGEDPRVGTFAEVDAGSPLNKLAFDQPVLAPTLTEGSVADPSPRLVTRVYVYTYVTEWGEESRPSPAATITVPQNQHVTVEGFYDSPGPDIEGRDFDKVRIYRSITSAQGGQLYFVADIDFGDSFYVDEKSAAEIAFNNTLFSDSNDPPPEGIYGVRAHPSGALVAFKGRDLYFSRPYLPHAWPEDYRLSVQDEIVAIEVFGQQVMIMTKGRPAVAVGSDPAFMALATYPFPEPCVSYNSVVSFPEGVYYASPDGLVLFTQNGPQIATEQVISRRQWQDSYGRLKLRAGRSGSQYVALAPCGNGFILDKFGMQSAFITLTNMPSCRAMTNDVVEGRLLMVDGPVVYEFDTTGAAPAKYTWRSKHFVSTRPVNFGALIAQFQVAQIPDNWFLASGVWGAGEWVDDVILNPDTTYDRRTQIMVEIIADGNTVFHRPVSPGDMVRPPDGYLGITWSVELTGFLPVFSVELTEVGREQAYV